MSHETFLCYIDVKYDKILNLFHLTVSQFDPRDSCHANYILKVVITTLKFCRIWLKET